MIFKDRTDAGRQLARRLVAYRNQDPIVLGLPRGGVVVAYEVARALDAPLDVVVARKLGAPQHPELAIGAIAPGGVLVLNDAFGVEASDVRALATRETDEMERRIRRYRGHDGLPAVAGRTVLLVDDGLATGLTARAALHAIRRARPKSIVLAVPVAAADSASDVTELVDDFVCLQTPVDLHAIGFWYADFRPVSDNEVVQLLESAQRQYATAGK